MQTTFGIMATGLISSLERFERAGLKIVNGGSSNPAGDLTSLILEQRSFEANLATVRAADEVLRQTLDLFV